MPSGALFIKALRHKLPGPLYEVGPSPGYSQTSSKIMEYKGENANERIS
uniref:Uncharacterized protein n=1 Tax=Myoviridae sp. ctj3P51 TaxID=2826687 RepID=A0A8S5NQ82_9CAUD|nr:MAG TPA: hypothetical protein [Myoviridae sp. ctj3P51]